MSFAAGAVTCVQPSVSLQKTPGACNLKYTSSDVIQASFSGQPLDSTAHTPIHNMLPYSIAASQHCCSIWALLVTAPTEVPLPWK